MVKENCVSGFNNDMTILKGYTGTTNQAAWSQRHQLLLGWKTFQTFISYCRYRRSYTAWFANNEKNGIIYRPQVGECGDSRHSCRVQETWPGMNPTMIECLTMRLIRVVHFQND